jgi:hypothetical protein
MDAFRALKFNSDPTAQNVVTAALMAYDKLNEEGGGVVWIVFFDPEERETVFVEYESDESEETFLQVKDELDRGLRPVCLSVIPFADPVIIPFHAEPTLDDLAVMDNIVEDFDEPELETDSCQ